MAEDQAQPRSERTGTYRARWIVPVASPPIENGYISTWGEYIRSLGTGRPEDAGDIIDFGDAIILPGLVNAHTHLELTHLWGKVPFDGSFTNWIQSLVAQLSGSGADEERRAAVAEGYRQSLAAGVTTVADIGYGARTIESWRTAPIRTFGYLEVLGMGPKRLEHHARSVEQAQTDIRQVDIPNTLIRQIGLSPHAPYSTDPIVYRKARDTSLPLCTHLAETKDEIQFLKNGTGSFFELLDAWGLWDGSFKPPGCSPVEYMRELKLFDVHPLFAPLLVHVNYVTDSDLDVLANTAATVVYCPRTHRFFNHEPHRYRDMLARGINVCIGTDSLAGNETLSILDELRFLRRRDAHIDNQTLLEMGTVRGAKAVHGGGSLKAGQRADFVVIPLSAVNTSDPVEDLLTSESSPTHVYINGASAMQSP